VSLTTPPPSQPSAAELSLSVLLILYYRHSPERPNLLSGKEYSQGKLDEYNIL